MEEFVVTGMLIWSQFYLSNEYSYLMNKLNCYPLGTYPDSNAKKSRTSFVTRDSKASLCDFDLHFPKGKTIMFVMMRDVQL